MFAEKKGSKLFIAVVSVAVKAIAVSRGYVANEGTGHVVAFQPYLRCGAAGAGSGVGVIAHCRNRRPDQSVLVMTNHVRDDQLLHHCQRLGADAVFHKASQLDGLVAFCKAKANNMPQCPA